MSTQAPSRQPSVVQSTQEQLDELDALVQRMLALPVKPLEDSALVEIGSSVEPSATESSSPGAEAESSLEQQGRSKTETALAFPPASLLTFSGGGEDEHEPTAAVEFSEASPFDSLESAPFHSYLLEDHPAPASQKLETTEKASAGAVETGDLAAVDTGPKALRSQREPQAVWWYRFLLRSNRSFDRLTLRLGEPGRWLRRPRGRAWLGWAGLALLAAVLLWGFLDCLGWTW